MKAIVKTLLENKAKTVPILSFPSAQLLGVSVNDLIHSPDLQAKGMLSIASRCPVGASLHMMDLSVEAEAFGAQVHFAEHEIPTVTKGVLADIEEVDTLTVPSAKSGRCPLYFEAVKKAKALIKDRPVFCGVIGPYSLAGRLFDMTELMMACYDSPDEVHRLLEKAKAFLVEYIRAFKEAGADGVMMAEPAAGLLSPSLAAEFSTPYVKEIFDTVSDENFVVCYHNCGNTVTHMAEDIAALPADVFHFGNAVDIEAIIPKFPKDKVVMGNLDPLLLKDGTKAEIKAKLRDIFAACSKHENFMLSTGCDVPAAASWENIDAYFETVTELYS